MFINDTYRVQCNLPFVAIMAMADNRGVCKYICIYIFIRIHVCLHRIHTYIQMHMVSCSYDPLVVVVVLINGGIHNSVHAPSLILSFIKFVRTSSVKCVSTS